MTLLEGVAQLIHGAKGIRRPSWKASTWVAANEHRLLVILWTDHEGDRQCDHFVVGFDDFLYGDWEVVPS